MTRASHCCRNGKNLRTQIPIDANSFLELTAQTPMMPIPCAPFAAGFQDLIFWRGLCPSDQGASQQGAFRTAASMPVTAQALRSRTLLPSVHSNNIKQHQTTSNNKQHQTNIKALKTTNHPKQNNIKHQTNNEQTTSPLPKTTTKPRKQHEERLPKTTRKNKKTKNKHHFWGTTKTPSTPKTTKKPTKTVFART